MLAYGVCCASGYFAPGTTLATTWVALEVFRRLGCRARKAAEQNGVTRVFDYSFWIRYGAWAVYSSMFLIAFPVLKWNAPSHPTWIDVMRWVSARPSNWLVMGPLAGLMALTWVVAPAVVLAAFSTAPAIGLKSTGLRLISIPIGSVRDVSWSEISRFVSWRMERQSSVINYSAYLADGTYFTLFPNGLAGGKELVDAIASHVPLEGPDS